MDYPQEKVLPEGFRGNTKRERVEDMFNHIAPTYDQLNHTLSLGIDRCWRKKAINILKPHRPKKILDVATGTGDFILLATQKLGVEQATGIDISEGMMQVAQKKVEKAKLAHVINFKHEDCCNLSFTDEQFDAVTVAFGIRNFESLDICLSEMCRVLRKGGHLVILELSTPERFPMKQLYNFYSNTFIPAISRTITKSSSAYTYLPESIKAFPQGEIMQKSIQRAGFSQVKFQRLTFGICTLYIACK